MRLQIIANDSEEDQEVRTLLREATQKKGKGKIFEAKYFFRGY